jgi:hypothetical protein
MNLAGLRKRARALGVHLPAPATLEKYGLNEYDWLTILHDQGWTCGVCGEFPKTGKFVTDHEHRRGWSKLPDAERARYVRGLTCWWDNRYLLARDPSIRRAEGVVAYLKRYEERRP